MIMSQKNTFPERLYATLALIKDGILIQGGDPNQGASNFWKILVQIPKEMAMKTMNILYDTKSRFRTEKIIMYMELIVLRLPK